ncbi:aminoglycoside phosphotransferase family protein [Chitinimonas sp. BJB300]|uniref:aminoglycoside phosphotransferase family protein n=1 Tax=Chitinimonas sp. BJB300 TaxID=1559339 RepID=UPI000C1118C7|nr:aminoglycoside phosphotransferase family protein [Chitinimonas sp. BJB300]PHV10090.1 aminoglycoside phosphotransferase [Chitinimonas sp. BJB300]TSJ87339.1 aminoglycoside phosphotransferase family protein [Chitinimonas sp. BJB300]
MTYSPAAIDVDLVRQLIASQFPQWAGLPISPVVESGWDNRTFHLGNGMLVRLPSAKAYSLQVEREQYWLPLLAPRLPQPIPAPLAMGEPSFGYPWRWSVYRWIEGEPVLYDCMEDLPCFASDLGRFLAALHSIDPAGGPPSGLHNFYRGGSLRAYDAEARKAISMLATRLDVGTATLVWDTALASKWDRPPVWVHGDIAVGNLLVKEGKLSAVIDFGQLCIGDPACDLAIAWTLFDSRSREVFRSVLPLDAGTWDRGRAWALWKALVVAADLVETNAVEMRHCWHTIQEILSDPVNPSSK